MSLLEKIVFFQPHSKNGSVQSCLQGRQKINKTDVFLRLFLSAFLIGFTSRQ
jgi:hypothetical protein